MDMFLKMYVATKPLNDTLVDHWMVNESYVSNLFII